MNPNPTFPAPPTGSSTGRGLGIGLGIGAAVLMMFTLVGAVAGYAYVKKAAADARKGWNLVPVVVAAVDVPEGKIVTFDMISQRSVPEQFVTSSVIKPDSASYIVNQRLLVPVQAGDPLLWSQFETSKAAERLASKVGGDDRVVAIKCAPEDCVGGWVRPNDHVDVIAVAPGADGKEKVAFTALENVVVVATGKITATTNINLIPEDQRKYSEVSLLLSPAQAERLTLLAKTGTLTLSLRNEENKAVRGKGGVVTAKMTLP